MTRPDWRFVEVDGTTYRWRPSPRGVDFLGSDPGCRVLSIELAPSALLGSEEVTLLLRTARETIAWDPADPDEDLDLRLLG
ncbi:hypothetical protein [Subtercola boreus]|uniref:hypothetical protein n=1 Tax=Subtercola boreus TaxID=120213 RepID=UPI0011C036C7|nr:hypothetical protein [Subtercola boreus]